MTKSKQSLKNSAKRGLLNTYIILCLISGCSSPTAPTYIKENIEESIQNICKNEYSLDVKVKLVDKTLWIYFPVEDMLVRADKPQKYSEKFTVEHNQVALRTGLLKLDYKISPVNEAEKEQVYIYNKDILAKTNAILKVLSRVIFSMKDSESRGPKFFCLITADIKNGFILKETIYLTDLKKVSYQFISWAEFQHRTIQDLIVEPRIIGNREGLNLAYKDITLEDFITEQIQYRIRLKFQKPEVDKNIDIDKEILKIAIYTLKTYEFRDFIAVELNNLLTQNRIILSEIRVFAGPIE